MTTPTHKIPLPKLHPAQVEIISDKHRFKVLACGRRFGKTVVGFVAMIQTALEKKNVAYMTPSYKQQMEVWQDALRVLGDLVVYKNVQLKRLKIMGGGTIDFWNYSDTIRGFGYSRVILDEAAMMKSAYTFETVIRPLLTSTKGDAWFLSTPRGTNWFYDYWRRGSDPSYPDWSSWQFPTSANPYIDPVEIESARRGISEAEFGQEYEASFSVLAGAVYPDFDIQGNVNAAADYDPAYPVIWSVDDGYTDPRVILLCQQRPVAGQPDRRVVFAEYRAQKEVSLISVSNVLSLGYPAPSVVYHDPAAAEFAGQCNAMGLATWGGYNRVTEGLNVVRRMIKDGNNERLLQIHPRCDALIHSLVNYRYVEGSNPPKPQHDDYSHPVDALRYWLATTG